MMRAVFQLHTFPCYETLASGREADHDNADLGVIRLYTQFVSLPEKEKFSVSKA